MTDRRISLSNIEQSTNTPSARTTKQLVRYQEGITFSPTPAQRRAKAKYWVAAQDLPQVRQPTLQSVRQLVDIPQAWWSDPQFKDWFLNRQDHVERVDYLYELFLDQAEKKLVDPEIQTKDLINMGKLLAELARKMPDKYTKVKMLDAGLADMSDAELKKIIDQSRGLPDAAEDSDTGSVGNSEIPGDE